MFHLPPVNPVAVQGIYMEFLHRLPDSAELAAAVDRLNKLQLTLRGLIAELVASPEYLNNRV